MDISKLFNLPARPLLVHIPVVLVPRAALAAVLIALQSATLMAASAFFSAGLRSLVCRKS